MTDHVCQAVGRVMPCSAAAIPLGKALGATMIVFALRGQVKGYFGLKLSSYPHFLLTNLGIRRRLCDIVIGRPRSDGGREAGEPSGPTYY
jgi:hypothetical protein